MKKFAFRLFRGFMWLIALLPFPILYLKADLLYYVLFYVIRYRRKVASTNLKNSFPEKSIAQIKAIEKKYYQNLADIVIEFIKVRHISRKSIQKRMIISNPEILGELYTQKKSIFIAIGHCGNWEWLAHTLALRKGHKPFAIIKPLSDPFFDAYMKANRTKFGGPQMIPFKQTYKTLLSNKHTINAVVNASDQTPARSEINFWTNFLNQNTPFFMGIGKMAKALDYSVLYFDIQRDKRGYYSIHIKPISISPKTDSAAEITEKYVSLLEQSIIENPDNWLWSHRRWKHKKQD
jgi:Kdo2-lipid IVA lauroyltransferase/acyltransferase